MKISAFDLSLTATGYAVSATGTGTVQGTITPKGVAGMDRLSAIILSVLTKCEDASLVIMEGLSYGSNNASAQERAGLAYLIRYRLWERGMTFILVPPTTLKKFVVGKGNAEKSM